MNHLTGMPLLLSLNTVASDVGLSGAMKRTGRASASL